MKLTDSLNLTALVLVSVLTQGVLTGGPVAAAAEYHVSPSGTPQGNGSVEQPWDLATALAGPQVVQPGDVFVLHAGTYRGGFESRLRGTAEKPVTVRAAAGERVTIDTRPRDTRDHGTLRLLGADAIYRDFEVTCSDPQRETKIAGSWPADIRRGSVDLHGSRLQLIHLVVHDLSNGFGFWAEGEGGTIGGCLIYNNGWRGPDRGHGHAIYTQNEKGTKRIVDNIMFQQFAYGLHAYGSHKASLKGFHIEGNIAFQNGCLTAKGSLASDMLVGGGCPAERVVIRSNWTSGGGVRLGYTWGPTNEDLICTDNRFDGGLVIRDFRQATVSRNTVVANSVAVRLEGAGPLLTDGHTWDKNAYFVTDGRWGDLAVSEGKKGRRQSLAEWRQTTGFDPNSTLERGEPTGRQIMVRPSSWQPGRAHVAVYNPEKLPEVELDLSTVLKTGQRFRIVSARNFYGPDVTSGTFDGQPVRLPMKSVPPASPVGMIAADLPEVEPAFGAFVVLPVGHSSDEGSR